MTRGELLLLARKRRCLRLRDVEAATRVSISTISRAERDERDVTFSVIAVLALYYGLDCNALARAEVSE